MLCYAILSFNFSFIQDISHSVYFTLTVSYYVHIGYVRAQFPHFTHSSRVLTLNLHIQVYTCYILLIRYLERTLLLRGVGVSCC